MWKLQLSCLQYLQFPPVRVLDGQAKEEQQQEEEEEEEVVVVEEGNAAAGELELRHLSGMPLCGSMTLWGTQTHADRTLLKLSNGLLT